MIKRTTKICRKCKKRKSITYFYAQRSNKDGLNTLCKKCYLNKNKPITEGVFQCNICFKQKSWDNFTPHRAYKTGRSPSCKVCLNKLKATRRLNRPEGVLAPPDNSIRVQGANYTVRVCSICTNSFEPIKRKQEECPDCGNLQRRLQSSLRKPRQDIRFKASVKMAKIVAHKYYWATNCVYCSRAFSPELTKIMDHITPICAGGSGEDAKNIAICCTDCNRCKAWLKKADWIKLCRLVVANLSNKIGSTPKAAHIPEN